MYCSYTNSRTRDASQSGNGMVVGLGEIAPLLVLLELVIARIGHRWLLNIIHSCSDTCTSRPVDYRACSGYQDTCSLKQQRPQDGLCPASEQSEHHLQRGREEGTVDGRHTVDWEASDLCPGDDFGQTCPAALHCGPICRGHDLQSK